MQRWQKLLARTSGRLLLFPGGLSWCTNQHACLHPIECRRKTTKEEKPLQHFCDFHGKLITIGQIHSHGTTEQRRSLTLKNTEQIAHRICDTEILPCTPPPPAPR